MATSPERVAGKPKRLLYAGVALAGVTLSVVGSAAFVGGEVVSRMSSQTAALAQLVPGMKLEEEVERGVFRSTRTVTLQVGCAPLPGDARGAGRAPPLVLRWHDDIQHGPFPGGMGFGVAVIDSRLTVEGALAERAKQLFGEQPPLRAHSHIGFGGSFESDVTIAAATFKRATDEVLFSGVTGRVAGRFPMAKGTLRYTWSEAPLSLRASSPDLRLELALGAVDVSSDVEIDPDQPCLLVPFRSDASIETMRLTTTAPTAAGAPPVPFEVALSKVKAKSTSTLDKGLFTLTHDTVGVLDVNGFKVDKFELGSSLRRLHASTYAKLLHELIDLGFSCEKKIDDPIAALPALADTAFELLPHDPEYGVGPIAIELDGKRAEVSYSVGTRGVTLNDKGVPMAALLAQKAVAHAEAKAHLGVIDEVARVVGKALAGTDPAGAQTPPGMPDPTALMARAMVDKFVSQGYLVREGEVVHSAIESVAGELKLNGKPFAMPDLGFGGP
jgi:uncharacterized protein YdgA (DUF945 family)